MARHGQNWRDLFVGIPRGGQGQGETRLNRHRVLPWRTRSAVLLLTGLGGFGCATAPSGPTRPPAHATSSTSSVSAHAQIVSNDEDLGGTASEVFARAQGAMDAGRLEHARTLFERVEIADRTDHPGAPPSALGRAAAYNAALCSEGLSDEENARDRYRALASAAPGTSDARDSLLRRARIDVELEDMPDLAAAASALLEVNNLASGDRAEALAYEGLSFVQQGELKLAEKSVQSAEKVLERSHSDASDAATPSNNAAAVAFARGELLRARGQALTFAPPSVDFSARMEARCQYILDAEDAYIDAIKTKEPRWAVRSGLRVASLYSSLHDDLLAIPPPKGADTEARKQLFRGAMRLRYRILLEKGLGTLEHTLNLQHTTGVQTLWLARAMAAKGLFERELEDERREIAKLPYSEAQLQKAFDDLAGHSLHP